MVDPDAIDTGGAAPHLDPPRSPHPLDDRGTGHQAAIGPTGPKHAQRFDNEGSHGGRPDANSGRARAQGEALGPRYDIYVLKATIETAAEAGPVAGHVDRCDEALQTVARSITQVRLHERLLRLAGVRLDRAGATLLFKLSAKGDSLRVTDLAEILGVDTPTVTRKVQQLERDGLVVRQTDPDDRRASRIRLTPAGRRTIERVRRARRAWLEQLLHEWDDDDLSALADLLGRFAQDLERDLDDARD
jgi:DNA-binding MarR family transcriptional regulator